MVAELKEIEFRELPPPSASDYAWLRNCAESRVLCVTDVVREMLEEIAEDFKIPEVWERPNVHRMVRRMPGYVPFRSKSAFREELLKRALEGVGSLDPALSKDPDKVACLRLRDGGENEWGYNESDMYRIKCNAADAILAQLIKETAIEYVRVMKLKYGEDWTPEIVYK